MAEENKSSKGIGQLYIEFVATGLGKFLKNLNTVSAQFLLGKNAANQFLQTITALPKEAGNSAVNVGKMSNALGTTYKEYMKLQMYLKSKNLSEGLLNDIANLNNVLFDFKGGLGELPAGISTALGRLGLGTNLNKYTTGLNGILKLLDDVDNKTKGRTKDFRNSIFRELGISSEFGYAFDRGDFNMRNAFSTISDESVEENIKMQEELAKSGVYLQQIRESLVSIVAPAIRVVSYYVGKISEKILQHMPQAKEEVNKIWEWASSGTRLTYPEWKEEQEAKKTIEKIFTFKNSKTKDQLTGGAAAIQELKNLGNDLMPQQIDKPPSYDFIRNETKKNGVMEERPWEPDPIQAAMPSNMSNLIQNVYITNDIAIQGNNAQETANAIAEIDRQDIEYSQFQMSNLAGL